MMFAYRVLLANGGMMIAHSDLIPSKYVEAIVNEVGPIKRVEYLGVSEEWITFYP